jgi:uncharacterized membrane protein
MATMSSWRGVWRSIPGTALGRVLSALLVGVGAGWVASRSYGTTIAALLGWNLGGACLCALAWVPIGRSSARDTQHHAAAFDPGRTAVYVAVTLSSAASLFAATVMSRRAGLVLPTEADELLALCLSTVALAWTITHTSFTLRYAHLYYRADHDGIGGLEFPGGAAPCYLDFAYLSFTVGMCFQVSDVAVSNSRLRRTVLLHAVISFTYNTAILAFALNLIFGARSG